MRPANAGNTGVARAAAFFDVDGTIVRGHMLMPMMWLFYRWGYLKPRHIAKTLYRRALFASGRIRQRDIDRMWEETLAFLKGRRQEEFTALLARAFAQAGTARVRPGVRALVREHRRLGHDVYLATSQTVEAAQPLADALAMDGVVGTRLEAVDGIYTGHFVTGYCYGERKAREVEAFCAERGIDLGSSWFYTDALVDLPLLERVANPVVVNPERPLARIAAQRGWPRLAFA